MTMQRSMIAPRRRFLAATALAAGAIGSLAVRRGAAPHDSGASPAPAAQPAGYRVSDHILKYYASAKL